MSTARSLLRLYPRPWRERYGDDFLATAGDGSLHAQQVIDIVFGAIDAWLSADVRRAARTYDTASNQGGSMTLKSMLACDRAAFRASKRDALIGAGVMIVLTLIFSSAGVAIKRAGWTLSGEVLLSLSFTAPLMLSMPFWMTKGQPWRAQAAIIAGTLAVLVGVSYLSAII
jgi:hypothetical protein